MIKIQLTATIPKEAAGKRLDQVLSTLFPSYSRARLQSWLKSNEILVNNAPRLPKTKVRGGEIITLSAQLEPEAKWEAQPIELSIVYEDDTILVVNKPAGLVVHPGPGNPDQTLVNALLHHCSYLNQLPRAGIIHRLDKGTSGLLVVAKTLEAHHHLVKQLQARQVKRQYAAILSGPLISGGTIKTSIGRHPIKRQRMAVVEHGGKIAITHYRILERFPTHTYVQVQLETGRTHQIRVHFAHLHHPVVGDPTYGKSNLPPKIAPKLRDHLLTFKRQALHAKTLGLTHPKTGKYMEWTVELPPDIQNLLAVLRETK